MSWLGGGSKFKKTEYFQLTDGEQVYAILRKDDKARFSMHYSVHFGYRNSQGKMRLFQSPLVKKNGQIEVPDAAQERIDALKLQLEAAKKDNNTEMVTRLEKLVGFQGQFNVDKKHYMNAMSLDGRIGLLKLSHKAKLALDEAIRTLEAKKIDPASRYFVFKRTGRGLDTTVQVTVYQKTITVEGVGEVNKDEVLTITPELKARIESDCRDLSDLYERPTSEQVARIVKGGPTAVDEVFAEIKAAKDARKADAPAAATATTAKTAPAPQIESEEDMDMSDDYVEPSFSAPTTVASSTVVAEAKAAVAATAPKTTAPAQSLATMSDDDFLASLNV